MKGAAGLSLRRTRFLLALRRRFDSSDEKSREKRLYFKSSLRHKLSFLGVIAIFIIFIFNKIIVKLLIVANINVI